MKVLGIDPGIGRMGWGIIEKNGQSTTPIDYGCFETDSKTPTPKRLSLIFHEVLRIIKLHRPDEIAIEELFFNTNAKTAFIVGQARGVILLAAAESGLSSNIYTPLQIKVAITGFGHAEKRQVGLMVKRMLNLNAVPKPDDTADALAIALTHSFKNKKTNML